MERKNRYRRLTISFMNDIKSCNMQPKTKIEWYHYDPFFINAGKAVESIFKEVAEKKGFSATTSTKYEDMHLHIDLCIEKYGKVFYVDVKSMGRVKRSGKKQDKWRWIELINVNGKKGWLYGNADIIAFQRKEDFVLVNRKNLLEWINENVTAITVTEPDLAYMKLYTRKNRKDIITLVSLKEMMENVHYKIWRI